MDFLQYEFTYVSYGATMWAIVFNMFSNTELISTIDRQASTYVGRWAVHQSGNCLYRIRMEILRSRTQCASVKYNANTSKEIPHLYKTHMSTI
jgi:hypothetical protein